MNTVVFSFTVLVRAEHTTNGNIVTETARSWVILLLGNLAYAG